MSEQSWEEHVRGWVTDWRDRVWKIKGDDPVALAGAEEALGELIEPDCRLIGVHGSEPDETTWAEHLPNWRGLQASAPDVWMDVDESNDLVIGSEASRKAVVFFTIRGTHTCAPECRAPSHQPLCAPGVCELTFSPAGKAAVMRQYFDATVLMRQLGLSERTHMDELDPATDFPG